MTRSWKMHRISGVALICSGILLAITGILLIDLQDIFFVAPLLLGGGLLTLLGYYYTISRKLFEKTIRYVAIILIILAVDVVALDIIALNYLDEPEKIQNDPEIIVELAQFFYSIDRNVIQFEDCARHDSTKFYTLRPGTCRFHNIEFDTRYQINDKGYRDDSRDPEIIVLGDSFAMGWGVDQAESFPEILEQDTGREVANLGMSSYGTARELVALSEIEHNASIIIIQYSSNDYKENVIRLQNDALPIESKGFYDATKVQYRNIQKYFPGKYALYTNYFILRQKIKPVITPPPTPAQEADVLVQVLELYAEELEGKELHILFMEDFDLVDEMQKELSQSDIKAIIAYEYLIPHKYVLDDHITPQGHKAIAAKLQLHIERGAE